jgi:hypothetical protein
VFYESYIDEPNHYNSPNSREVITILGKATVEDGASVGSIQLFAKVESNPAFTEDEEATATEVLRRAMTERNLTGMTTTVVMSFSAPDCNTSTSNLRESVDDVAIKIWDGLAHEASTCVSPGWLPSQGALRSELVNQFFGQVELLNQDQPPPNVIAILWALVAAELSQTEPPRAITHTPPLYPPH